MANNEFKPFATAAGANVTSQSEWESLPALFSGFTSGKASSAQINKAVRQASVIASVVAQFIADTNDADVLDNGNIVALEQSLLLALQKNAASNIPVASTTAAGIVRLSNATSSDAETLAATPFAVRSVMQNADGRLAKNQNGADIPDKVAFAKNAQVPHLGSSWIEFGGSAGAWTTSQFIDFLNSIGAFDHLYFVCAGTWSFSANKKIIDTGCGHVELAGAVVEVFASRFNLRTVRVTTMSSSSDPLAIQGQFVYVESETPGSGEWRREFNTKNLTANDIGAVQISEIVGMPQPWPLTTIPSGWLPCAGQSFDTSAYPILASRYPSGILPDLRGEFIRGWDNGRGVDPARTNLSGQAFATESHTHASGSLEVGSGTPLYVGKGLQDGGGNLYSRTGVNNNAGTETRPRNIAFNYIVRAA